MARLIDPVCCVQPNHSPSAQIHVLGTPALPSQHSTAGNTESSSAGPNAGTEQQQSALPGQQRLEVAQRLAGNTALLEAEEALEQGRIGMASARLLFARYCSTIPRSIPSIITLAVTPLLSGVFG